MCCLTERIVTPFVVLNFLAGGGESSFSVLLCFILPDKAGFVGMLRIVLVGCPLSLVHDALARDTLSPNT